MRLIALHRADQLVLSHNKTTFGRKWKKMCFYLKIVSFTVFFCLLLIKLYTLLIGAAVDFDDFTVFLPSRCQVTKLHFPRLYNFVVLIAK